MHKNMHIITKLCKQPCNRCLRLPFSNLRALCCFCSISLLTGKGGSIPDPTTNHMMHHCTAINCEPVVFFTAVSTHRMSASWLAAKPSWRPCWRELLLTNGKWLLVQLATHTLLPPQTTVARLPPLLTPPHPLLLSLPLPKSDALSGTAAKQAIGQLAVDSNPTVCLAGSCNLPSD